MLHGLLFLPVLLMILIPEKRERKIGNKVHDKPKAVFTCESQMDLRNEPPMCKEQLPVDAREKKEEHEVVDAAGAVEEPRKEAPSDEEVVKATVDRLTGKVLTPDDRSPM
ncbi:hypothetical protein ANCDUO_05671 [Ancylostoma duodenale]|uniref:Secreted protein n=1 Tax=Ancylostoma duodenale TaxID=51022 RepID=A0A0C2D3J3_9BILA|nr:hypothetical protein ANCDUO_05671 [Ancylostoma duodenale]